MNHYLYRYEPQSQHLVSRSILPRVRTRRRLEWAVFKVIHHWIIYLQISFYREIHCSSWFTNRFPFSFLSLFCFQRPEHFVMGIKSVAITCDCRQSRISVIIVRRALCIRFTRLGSRRRPLGKKTGKSVCETKHTLSVCRMKQISERTEIITRGDGTLSSSNEDYNSASRNLWGFVIVRLLSLYHRRSALPTAHAQIHVLSKRPSRSLWI